VEALFPHASAVIVGSYFKSGGRWDGPVDPTRVNAFTRRVAGLR